MFSALGIASSQGIGGGGPTPWTPAQLGADLVAWFDPSDAATITEVSGKVSQLDDKSGSGNHATQGTGAAQPVTASRTINGFNVLDYDGTDDWLNVADGLFASGASTIAAVGYNDTGGFDVIVGAGSDAGTNNLIMSNANSWGLYYAGGNSVVGGTSTVPSVVGLLHDASDATLSINGDTTSFTPTGGAGDAQIGIGTYVEGALFWDGVIGEVVLVNKYLSVADRQKLEGYLAHKWQGDVTDRDLLADLPSGHPYKSSPPTV